MGLTTLQRYCAACDDSSFFLFYVAVETLGPYQSRSTASSQKSAEQPHFASRYGGNYIPVQTNFYGNSAFQCSVPCQHVHSFPSPYRNHTGHTIPHLLIWTSNNNNLSGAVMWRESLRLTNCISETNCSGTLQNRVNYDRLLRNLFAEMTSERPTRTLVVTSILVRYVTLIMCWNCLYSFSRRRSTCNWPRNVVKHGVC